jgi:hypothetical protein
MGMFSHETPLRGRRFTAVARAQIHYGNSTNVTTHRAARRETDAQPADAATFATGFRPAASRPLIADVGRHHDPLLNKCEKKTL